MDPDAGATFWVRQLERGNRDAAQELWRAYHRRLVGLARRKLDGLPRRAVDEEDVALSAFTSFCRRVEGGHYPRIEDRDGLWRLLLTITAHKAWNVIRDARRRKRGGGLVRGESGLVHGPGDTAEAAAIDGIIGPEPTPEFAAQVAEQLGRLLDALADQQLRSIAVFKMEGYTNAEIADRLNCAPSTVDRRLRLIRQIWEQERVA
jgi:RNA polymerase sigma factor (sigma-70 family)